MAVRAADPAIAAYQQAHSADFTRKVLNVLDPQGRLRRAPPRTTASRSTRAPCRPRSPGSSATPTPRRSSRSSPSRGSAATTSTRASASSCLVQRIAAVGGQGRHQRERAARPLREGAALAEDGRTSATSTCPTRPSRTPCVGQLKPKPSDYPALAAKYPGAVHPARDRADAAGQGARPAGRSRSPPRARTPRSPSPCPSCRRRHRRLRRRGPLPHVPAAAGHPASRPCWPTPRRPARAWSPTSRRRCMSRSTRGTARCRTASCCRVDRRRRDSWTRRRPPPPRGARRPVTRADRCSSSPSAPGCPAC